MKKFLLTISSTILFATAANASTICFETNDSNKTVFENSKMKIVMVSKSGKRYLSVDVVESSKDSGTGGMVEKTYSQGTDADVLKITFVNGEPNSILTDEEGKNLSLTFNSTQSVTHGAACYDLNQ